MSVSLLRLLLLLGAAHAHPLPETALLATPISPADRTPLPTPLILPPLSNPSATALLVALACTVLILPMFAYIWIRRRRLRRAQPGAAAPRGSKILLVRKIRGGVRIVKTRFGMR